MIDNLDEYINKLDAYITQKKLTENDLTEIDRSIKSLSELLKNPIETHSISIDTLTQKLQELINLSDKSLPRIQEAVSQLEQFKTKASLHFSDKSSVKGKPELSSEFHLKRLLFQIVADSFGQNSSLEGMAGDAPLKYLQNYLQFRKSNEETDPLWNGEELNRLIDQAVELDFSKNPADFKKEFSDQAAKAWDAKKPMLFRGGWTAAPFGHALYFLLIPMPDNKWNMRLYNVGGGAQFHGEELVGLKKKVHEVMEWEGIKKGKISESFAQAIYEFINFPQNPNPPMKHNVSGSKIPKSNTETQFREEDIYINLKNYLEPERVKKLEKPADMSPQHAGVCTWKSLLAFMRNQMDEKEYRLFKCEIQQQILLDNVKANHAPDIMAYNLVKKGYEKLNRYLYKLEHEKVISENDISQIPQALEPIQAWLELHKNVMHPAQNFHLPDSRIWNDRQHPLESKAYVNDLSIGSKSLSLEKIEKPVSDQVSEFNFNAKTFKKDLEEILHSLEKAWKHEDDLALNLSCLLLMKKIPLLQTENGMDKINEDLFNELSPEEKREIIKMIGKLGRLFFKSCLTVQNAEEVSIERIYVLYKIMKLQGVLAKELGLQGFNFWNQPLKSSLREKLFSHISDPQIAREMDLMMKSDFAKDSFIKNCHVSALPFNISHHWKPPEWKERSFFDFCCSIDPFFKEKFINEYPQIVDQAKNFKVASQEVDGRAYGSNIALPEWFRAMRDNYVYSLWLMTGEINKVPLTMVNRNDEASQDFLKMEFQRTGDNEFDVDYKLSIGDAKIFSNQKPFENLFRPFISEALHKVMLQSAYWIESRSLHHEKFLLKEDVEKLQIKLTKEEIQELLLINGSSNLWGVDALAYFTRHPEKLKDPDYQTIFKILFFPFSFEYYSREIRSLFNEIKANPTFGKDLSEFVRQQYLINNIENETETCLFLLQMMRHLSGFCPGESFIDPIIEIHSFLKKPGLSPEQRSLLYAELSALLSYREALNDQEAKDLLAARIQLTKESIPDKWKDPETVLRMEEALIKHETKLRQALTSQGKDAFINGILSSAATWTMQSEEPLEFISNEEPARIYRPLEGALGIKGKGLPIPLKLKKNAEFQELFPNQMYAEYVNQGEYTFTDANGVPTRVFWDPKSDKRKLAIDQQINEKWYRHVTSDIFIVEPVWSYDTLKYILGSRYITSECSHWYELSNKDNLIFRDKEKGTSLYQGRIGGAQKNCLEVSRISDGAQLGEPGSFSPPFTNFEDPGYIEMWYKNSRIKEVSLPRFSLNFEIDDKGQWILKEHKGFHLVKDGRLPFLGAFPHFLLLENEEGLKKVLIPKQQFFLPSLTKKEALQPEFLLEKNLNQPVQGYQEFSIDSSGQLVTKNPAEALRVAEILILSQKYASAASILDKAGQKLGLFDDAEQKILRTILEQENISGDFDANAIALRNYAGSLLVRNFKMYGKDQELSKDDLTILQKIYAEYLSRFGNITTGLKLTIPDELLLIQTLNDKLKIAHDPLLATRLRELTKQESRIVDMSLPKMPSDHLNQMDLESLLNTELSSNDNNLTNELMTRPWNTLTMRFPYYLQSAVSDDPKRIEELKLQLSFLSHPADDKEKALYDLYSIILKYPEQFRANLNQEGVLSQAKKLYPEYLLSQAPSKKLEEVLHERTIKPKYPLQQKREQLPLSYSISEDAEPLSSLCRDCFSVTQKSKIDDKTFQEITSCLKDADPLKADFKAYKEMQASSFTIKEGKIKDIKEALNKNMEAENNEQEALRVEIVNLANDLSGADQKVKTLIQLEREGGKRKLATLNDVMMSFGRQDTAALQEFNPTLSSKEIGILYSKMGRFLMLATKKQQRERAENIVKKLEEMKYIKDLASAVKDHLITDELANTVKDHLITDEQKQLFDEVNTMDLSPLEEKLALELRERAYKPQENPAALVFEYYANILIRNDQIAKLDAFMKSGNQNLIMEMIMGSGKSKVLLPLLGLLRARGKDLSMLVVLPTQIAAVAADTQNMLGEAFGQKLQSIPFDRNSGSRPEDMQDMIRRLKSIIEKQESLISTNKTIGCLILKYIENMSVGASQELIALMKEAINLLRKQGVPILDEVDTILNVMLELNFSLGLHVSPTPTEINVIGAIYHILYEDPEIKSLCYLESDPSPAKEAPPLGDKVYQEVLKEKLAMKFLKSLSSSDNEKVKGFMRGADESSLVFYLCRNQKNVKKAQAYYNAINDLEIKNIFALAGEEISRLLPHTLTRNCDEKYGFDPLSTELVAIPFSDANTPNRGSQFANHHVAMNYTFQAIMKNGVSFEYLKRAIDTLHGNAKKELMEMGEQDITKTNAYKLFEQLRGDQNFPMNMNDEMLKQFQKWINDSIQRKLFFAENIILPSMKIYSEKLSWNPQNMGSFFEKPGGVGGFTGTLWNSGSMHPQLKPAPAAGTDAKTFHILWEQTRDKNATIITKDTQNNYLKKMQSYDAIIDRGGILKEKSNLAVAQEWSQKIDKPVVFYDKKGNQCITYKDDVQLLSKSPFGPDKYVTFYDQVHTLGADIKQKGNAKGIVTIGRSILKRDLFQAVWRFRELDKGQRVEFIMTEEVAALIRQKIGLTENEPITFEHIYTFASMNQEEQTLRDNFKALKQQIWNVPQKLLLKILLDEKVTEKQSRQAFKLLKSTWISKTYKSPADMYGTIPIFEKSSKVINEEALRAEKLVKDLFLKCSWLKKLDFKQKSLTDEISAISKRKVALPEFVTFAEGDEDQAAEAQQEKEQEAEKEQEKETLQELMPDGKELGRKSGDIEEYPDWNQKFITDYFNIPSFPVSKYLAKDEDKELMQFQDFFEGINMTFNVPEWFETSFGGVDEKTSFKLLGNVRIPFQYVLIDGEKITLLSQLEADNEKLKKNQALYHLTLGYIQKPGKPLTAAAKEKITKLKFLNGESFFSKEEQIIMSNLINKHGKAKIMALHKKILSGYPMKAEQFQGSILQKLLSDRR